jgi:tRNA(fMet)-specific endonuclease VapC
MKLRYLLDTNAAIALKEGRSSRLLERVLAEPDGSIALSIIVAYELYFGAFASSRVDFNIETLQMFLADFVVLDLSQDDVLASGKLRAALKRVGTPIGPYDNLIAGQALARGLTVVTNNTREFQRAEGLAVEDWTT